MISIAQAKADMEAHQVLSMIHNLQQNVTYLGRDFSYGCDLPLSAGPDLAWSSLVSLLF
jgi:hypothetical protein